MQLPIRPPLHVNLVLSCTTSEVQVFCILSIFNPILGSVWMM